MPVAGNERFPHKLSNTSSQVETQRGNREANHLLTVKAAKLRATKGVPRVARPNLLGRTAWHSHSSRDPGGRDHWCFLQ